jgi:dipeptidyl aminopeptidase/acylaminoacyl peptidase
VSGCLHDDGEQLKILFATDRDGDYALYAMEEDGREQTRILGLPDAPRKALVAPDGRSVLIVGQGLWVRGLDGKHRDQLVAGDVFDAAWSPDGKRIAYASARGLSVVSSDGASRRRLTRRDTDGAPAWSPDGRRLAFSAEDGVWVIGSDGRARTHLTRVLTSANHGPVWDPDGERIAFVGGDLDSVVENLYVVQIGGAPRRLLRGAGGPPAWSPDGAQLACLTWPAPQDGRFEPTLAILDARNGGRLRTIPDVEEGPLWSSDGTRLLIATLPAAKPGSDELAQVAILESDGSGRRRLTGSYPDGTNRPLGWIAGDHATEPPPRAAIEELPSGAKMLRVPHPVGVVSAEGGTGRNRASVARVRNLAKAAAAAALATRPRQARPASRRRVPRSRLADAVRRAARFRLRQLLRRLDLALGPRFRARRGHAP